jgi:hypothetical protein
LHTTSRITTINPFELKIPKTSIARGIAVMEPATDTAECLPTTGNSRRRGVHYKTFRSSNVLLSAQPTVYYFTFADKHIHDIFIGLGQKIQQKCNADIQLAARHKLPFE